MRRFTVILCSALVLVVGLLTALIFYWMRDIPADVLSSAEFSAAVVDAGGVDTSSAFVLKAEEAISSISVRRMLQVTPEIEVGVHQGTSANEILVVPSQPLAAGTLYTFTFRTDDTVEQWSFQTKQEVSSLGSRPQHQQTGVSLGSAIEIVLDQMQSVDLAAVADYFSISPATDGTFRQYGKTLCFTPAEPLQPGTVYHVEIAAGLPFVDTSVCLAESIALDFETVRLDANLHWQVSTDAAIVSGTQPQFAISLAGLSLADEQPLEFDVELYEFAEASDYAALWNDVMERYPLWTDSCDSLQNLDISLASLRSRMRMPALAQGDDYLLTWPTPPPAGYYLLRLFYQGYSRDVLFCVSEIAAFVQADEVQTLLWLHDTAAESLVGAEISSFASGQRATLGTDGLARLDFSADYAVYLVTSPAQKSMVLPVWRNLDVSPQNTKHWRYLYLDQSQYQSGDVLKFFGLVQPKDGSALEYSRVSVYLATADGSQVLHSYADLANNFFSGSIELPELSAGGYVLQISQSGQVLVERGFVVGQPEQTAGRADAGNTGRLLQLDRSTGYTYGMSYSARYEQGEGEYLFIEAERNIEAAAVGSNSQYIGSFAPRNQLNRYLMAVYWDGSRYYPSASAQLALDADPYAALLQLDAPRFHEVGSTGTFSLAATDQNGAPLAEAQVVVSIVTAEQAPADNPLRAIYQDYQVQTLSGQALPEATPLSTQTLYYALYQTDSQGQLQGEFTIPLTTEPCYLLVQVIHNGAVVTAGSAVERIYLMGDLQSGQAPEPEPAAAFAFQAAPLADAHTISGRGGEELLLIASYPRIQLLSLFFECFTGLDYADPSAASAETVFAAAAAAQMLTSYVGDLFATLPLQSLDCSRYQLANGGLSAAPAAELAEADVFLSAKAALLTIPGVAAEGLNRYFDFVLSKDLSRLEWLAALVGKAALGHAVWNDLNTFLAAPDLSYEEELWLALGLALCQDSHRLNAFCAEFSFSGATAAEQELLALVYAHQGASAAALSALSAATLANPEGVGLAQVVVANCLLPLADQLPTGFSYHMDATPYEISLTERSLFVLPLNGFAGDIYFDVVPAGYGYCHLYQLTEDDIILPNEEKKQEFRLQ